MPTDLRRKYTEELRQLGDHPGYNRKRAEKRFLLIKEYEDIFLKRRFNIFRSIQHSKVSLKAFCETKRVPFDTFYKWYLKYHKNGITALLPAYGKAVQKRHTEIIRTSIRINTRSPLACLSKLKEIIQLSNAISPEVKAFSVKILNFNLVASKHKANLSIDPPLTQEEVTTLKRYKNGRHKKHSIKATVILMAHNNCTMPDVMMATGRPIRTIYRWLREFEQKRTDCIETRPFCPAREKAHEERKIRVIDIVHKHPSSYNINLTAWTYPAIAQAYKATYGQEISRTIIQHIVKNTGYTWRHARKVLTSPDPEYKTKIEKVLDTLQALQEHEAFFFIDEAGPYRVRKYGGRTLVKDDAVVTIPEYQISKGKVQFVAALEARTNQLTWLFTENKGSTALIALINALTVKHKDCSRIFLTWDAISVHSSKELMTWIENHNQETGNPVVEVVPLPSNSQFLNVIEAVFGGMKRAVICNSDYPSAKAMKEAIARHFEERNQYYQDNPKRAGNKIWDKQAFDVDRLIGGLFKKM